jgi:hypothetical protein
MFTLINQAALIAELKSIEAESIGWSPLDQGVYLHTAPQINSDHVVIVDVIDVIDVVGVAHASMAGTNVLWLL